MNHIEQIPDLRPVIKNCSESYGLHLDESKLASLQEYYSLVVKGNRTQNLVSKNDLRRFAEYHILDALKVVSCFDFTLVGKLLDFGTGAGVPGVPLAITFPAMTACLVDSRPKRCAFLDEACSAIPVQNAHVLCSRIERIPTPVAGDLFDVVITRATVSLERFYSLTNRFVSPGGVLIAIKGDTIDRELENVHSSLDTSLFNITCAYPTPVTGVRSGRIIIFKKNKLLTNMI